MFANCLSFARLFGRKAQIHALLFPCLHLFVVSVSLHQGFLFIFVLYNFVHLLPASSNCFGEIGETNFVVILPLAVLIGVTLGWEVLNDFFSFIAKNCVVFKVGVG